MSESDSAQNKAPRVSVFAPAYNVEHYIRESVESILTQTFTDFEFIVIDDGSTDGTGAILDSIEDARLRVFHNEVNIGLSASMNKYIGQARGELIARHDADDISLPLRLAKQVAYLDQHPEIGILSTAGRYTKDDGLPRKLISKPLDDLSIRWHALLSSPFMHNSVIWRRSLWEKFGLSYDAERLGGQDFDLWYRMLKHMQGANLAEALVLYRLHSNMNTVRLRSEQLSNHNRSVVRNLKEQFDMDISLEQANLLSVLYGPGGQKVPDLETHRAEITILYLEMIKKFSVLYHGRSGLARIKHKALNRVINQLLASPLRNENIRLLPSLITYF
jgi:glycosyltransferase involved in cell wall biosynthesis